MGRFTCFLPLRVTVASGIIAEGDLRRTYQDSGYYEDLPALCGNTIRSILPFDLLKEYTGGTICLTQSSLHNASTPATDRPFCGERPQAYHGLCTITAISTVEASSAIQGPESYGSNREIAIGHKR